MRKLLTLLLLIPSLCFGTDITLDPNTTYQTWRAWATYPYTCHNPGDCPTAWPDANIPSWALSAFDTGVNDLGITMVMHSTFSNQQHSTNFWANSLAICNSSGWTTQACRDAFNCYVAGTCSGQDVNTTWMLNRAAIVQNLSAGSFHWDQTDWHMDKVVIPFKTRVESTGQKFWMSSRIEDRGYGLNGSPAQYGFPGGIGVNCDNNAGHWTDYGNFWKNFYDHINSKYGFLPDLIDFVNEPDTSGSTCWVNGTGTLIGNMVKVAGDIMTGAGYAPKFSVTSSTNTGDSLSYFTNAWAVTNARPYIDSVSYHLYSGNTGCTDYACGSGCSDIASMGSAALSDGILSSMNEVLGPNYLSLHSDIKCGNVSMWDGMYAFVTPTKWGTTHTWLTVTDDSNHTVSMPNGTYLVRQYSRYIRPGAQRISATGSPTYDPVAFVKGGKYTVVLKVTSADPATKTIGPLPAGTYGIRYSVSGGANDQALTDQVLASTGDLTIPSGAGSFTGVLTVYDKSLGFPVTPFRPGDSTHILTPVITPSWR